eukprot:COSAG02_NODE_3417_length_6780_cov_54.323006_7_plen_414_part_00
MFVLVFMRSVPVVASVPVLGLCLSLGAGCFIALGLLGLIATTKLTGLLYLVRVIPNRFCTGVVLCSFRVACEQHLVLMTTLQVGTAFTVGSVLLARVDIARIVTADTFLQEPESLPPEQRDACKYHDHATLSGRNGIFGYGTVGATASGGGGGDDVGGGGTDTTADDVDVWIRCWTSLGLSHESVLGQSPARYAVLIEMCACGVLLLGMATSVGDLGLAATTELSMVGVEAVIVALGSVEAAFGIWVMMVAPSHSLGLVLLLLGSSIAAVGLSVAFWYTQCAHRFRRRMPFVPVTAVDPAEFERSRRWLQFALCLHLLLLLVLGTFVLQSNTLTSVQDYAYEFYRMNPPGLSGVNAGPESVLVARIRAVSADTAIASAVGIFSICAAVFTVLLLNRLSYYVKRLAVDDRDSLL